MCIRGSAKVEGELLHERYLSGLGLGGASVGKTREPLWCRRGTMAGVMRTTQCSILTLLSPKILYLPFRRDAGKQHFSVSVVVIPCLAALAKFKIIHNIVTVVIFVESHMKH